MAKCNDLCMALEQHWVVTRLTPTARSACEVWSKTAATKGPPPIKKSLHHHLVDGVFSIKKVPYRGNK